MVCPSCGTLIRDRAAECPECGAILTPSRWMSDPLAATRHGAWFLRRMGSAPRRSRVVQVGMLILGGILCSRWERGCCKAPA